MIHGSCLCGGIKYEISGNIESVGKCDCVECRKMTGSEFSANALIREDTFQWLEGKGNIAIYQISEEVSRTFCKICGSNLQYIANKHPEIIGIALGTVDDDIKKYIKE
jgi:hypothetical protein